MSYVDDAVAKYHKLLETGPYSDLSWAEALHDRMEESRLSSGGRLICPVLRPNFISRRQYENLVKNSVARPPGVAACRKNAGGYRSRLPIL
jgi:hypothetical protein